MLERQRWWGRFVTVVEEVVGQVCGFGLRREGCRIADHERAIM